MSKHDNFIMFASMNTLFELSADEKKRLEYEAREKAIRDHNTQMNSAEQRGIELALKVLKLKSEGKSADQIAEECERPLELVKRIMEQ